MSENIERMAQAQNLEEPPATISIPTALAPIVEAFSVESEITAKALIRQAAKTIYARSEHGYGDQKIRNDEVESIFALMKAIKPTSVLEIICASQIIVGHLLGLRKLSLSFKDDQRLGLKLLRFSNDALERLEKMRGGGGSQQHINVVYQNVGATMQTVVAPMNKD